MKSPSPSWTHKGTCSRVGSPLTPTKRMMAVPSPRFNSRCVRPIQLMKLVSVWAPPLREQDVAARTHGTGSILWRERICAVRVRLYRSQSPVVTVLEYLAERRHSYISVQIAGTSTLDDQARLALSVDKHQNEQMHFYHIAFMKEPKRCLNHRHT